MSSNSVFKVAKVTCSEQSFHYIAEVNASHPVFDGHFPQMPVVPGVCTIDLVKRCLSDAISREVRYDYIKECKFLSAIIPSQHKLLNVTININQQENQVDIAAQVVAGETKMLKLKATLK